MTMVFTIFGVLIGIWGPAWVDVLDVFHFHHLPLAFTWQLYLLQCSFLVLYMIVLSCVIHLCRLCGKCVQNKVVPCASNR